MNIEFHVTIAQDEQDSENTYISISDVCIDADTVCLNDEDSRDAFKRYNDEVHFQFLLVNATTVHMFVDRPVHRVVGEDRVLCEANKWIEIAVGKRASFEIDI